MESPEPQRRPHLELRPRRAGEVLTAGFEVYGRGWRELLTIAAIVTIPLTIATAFLADWILRTALEIRAQETATVPRSFWTVFAATIITVVIGALVTLLAQAAMTRAVADVVVGREPSVSRSYRAALSRFGPLLGATLLILLGVMAGFFLLVVPGIFLVVRWLVAVPAIVLERRGATDGMRRSWELVRGEGWHAFALLLVVSLLTGVFGELLARLFPPDLLLQAIGGAITQVIVLPFATSVYTVLWVNLRVAKEQLERATLEAELGR